LLRKLELYWLKPLAAGSSARINHHFSPFCLLIIIGFYATMRIFTEEFRKTMDKQPNPGNESTVKTCHRLPAGWESHTLLVA
jgi:hypothetical protein